MFTTDCKPDLKTRKDWRNKIWKWNYKMIFPSTRNVRYTNLNQIWCRQRTNFLAIIFYKHLCLNVFLNFSLAIIWQCVCSSVQTEKLRASKIVGIGWSSASFSLAEYLSVLFSLFPACPKVNFDIDNTKHIWNVTIWPSNNREILKLSPLWRTNFTIYQRLRKVLLRE